MSRILSCMPLPLVADFLFLQGFSPDLQGVSQPEFREVTRGDGRAGLP